MTRVGTVLSLPDVVLAELIGEAFDLAWLDLEHGALAIGDVAPLAIGLRAARCEAHVRVPTAWSDVLPAAMDAGVDGIVIPGAEDAQALAAALERFDYPPAGRRGYGPRRTGSYGREPLPFRPACTVQVESPAAVADADAIASVPGVDALVVGCADLAMALHGEVVADTEELRAAVAEVERAAAAAGVAFGIAGAPPAAIPELCTRPPQLVVHSVDVRLIARAADAAAAAARSSLQPEALAHGRH